MVSDAGEGLAGRAVEKLERFGYADVSVLRGGIQAWEKAGHELFSGISVPSKAFGEVVEHIDGTPNITRRSCTPSVPRVRTSSSSIPDRSRNT